ncbi:histidine kinase [Aquibacillus saliphilus]|uniref:histidine kinase n=1 Tax=Aquibacillus saliphilus TaxID=1909422 RepID=UPI001CF093FA|nr:histidine kinase [Aquibacillus saliphilus]
MKLRNKLFITFAVLVLIPLIIIGVAVHQIFATSKSEEVITKTENTIIQLNQNLDLMMEDAARDTLSVLYNNSLLNILREYKRYTPVFYKNYNHSNSFSLFLSASLYNKEQVDGIHVFTNNGQTFSHMDDYRIDNSIDLEAQEWYSSVRERQGDWMVLPEHIPTYYKKNDESYVSLIRLLRDPNDKKQLGFIKVDFSPGYLDKITEQLPSENWQIFREGKPLFQKERDQLLLSCNANGKWIEDTQSSEEYLCVSNTSSKTGIQISNVIPKTYLYSEIKDFNFLLITVLVISLFVSLILSYFMSNYLLKPLELLKKRIKEFQVNKMSNQISVESKGDIGELGGAYNYMLSEINSLVEETYELNRRNSEAEFKALQSRMDPHFIFNALESINMTAIARGQLELSDMISELGRLIRYRLRNDEQQISLKEEIDFTETYVAIMKRRLGDSLVVEWNIADGVTSYQVPKYIIQPLIENAIAHGFDSQMEDITITIKIELEGGKLQIAVYDNGTGIGYKRLQKIKESINNSIVKAENQADSTSQNNGIALENIASRLKLIHGENSRLFINAEPGKGTRINIVIPIEE